MLPGLPLQPAVHSRGNLSFVKNIQYSLIGIACEHFVLQAAEEGVGTYMIGWFSEKNVKKILILFHLYQN